MAPFIKWHKVLLAFLLLLCVQSVSAQSKYVRKYRPLADSLSSEYGIPSSVILGVAIIESGSGTSRNCKLLNNHFGIVGKNKVLKTHGVKTKYKQYPNGRESYIGFCRLLTKKKYYAKLKGNKDYRAWTDVISRHNYSEIPVEWKKRVDSTIRKNKLSSHSLKKD
jgi:flagellum-specific peptidoglycan hydrolase FlgJ